MWMRRRRKVRFHMLGEACEEERRHGKTAQQNRTQWAAQSTETSLAMRWRAEASAALLLRCCCAAFTRLPADDDVALSRPSRRMARLRSDPPMCHEFHDCRRSPAPMAVASSVARLASGHRQPPALRSRSSSCCCCSLAPMLINGLVVGAQSAYQRPVASVPHTPARQPE